MLQGESALSSRIRCILFTGAATLDAINDPKLGNLVNVAVNFMQCKATAEGERTGCCFAAGTPVHTNHGDVPVEKVEVGDEVLARNSKTGKLENEPVTALTTPHQDHVVDLRIEGERDPLRPSDDHPFWVRRGGDPAGAWMEAGKLRLGDLLETTHGTWRRITAITPESHEQTVYNFTVANDHDYFVGETGFLVHNAGPCPCGRRTPEENRQARNYFKNNKQEARDLWEGRTGNQWPTDENGMPWPAEHDPPLKEGGDPMNVYPRDPGAPDPHNIPGPSGLTDYQIWGALGTAARLANQLCDLEE